MHHQQNNFGLSASAQSDDFKITVVLDSQEARFIYRDVDWKTAMNLISGRHGYRLIFGRIDLMRI